MSNPMSIPFRLESGDPIIIRFTDTDGVERAMRLAATVFQVLDNGPGAPPETRYTVQAQWHTRTT